MVFVQKDMLDYTGKSSEKGLHYDFLIRFFFFKLLSNILGHIYRMGNFKLFRPYQGSVSMFRHINMPHTKEVWELMISYFPDSRG